MITVFTPTYNRAYIISKLYESLCNQINKDFEWLVVDDGSVDDTEFLIKSFIAENKITIRYIKQLNGGKHIAINTGVEAAKGDLFFIVDSDDYLTPDAVDWFLSQWCSIKDDSTLVGISGVRIHPDGRRIGGGLSFETVDCTPLEFGMRLGIKGDLAEAFKTDTLKMYPFPSIKGEKFCPEALVFFRMANDGYKLCYTNTKIYVCEYQEGGLTDNIVKVRMLSPETTLMYYSELKNYNIPLKYKFRAFVNYWRFSFCSSKTIIDKVKQIGWLSLPAYPIGYMMHFVDRNRMKK